MQRSYDFRPAPGGKRWYAGWLLPLLLLLLLTGGALRSHGQATIARAEYFIDTDPGYAAATAFALPATPAADLPGLSASIALSSLSTGFHTLGVRSQDANGAWSLTSRRAFYYEPALSNALANINKVEYFIDADPGYAAATDVPVTAGTDINGIAFNVNLSSLSAGFHQLGLRSRDANGQWSLTSRRTFYYEPVLSGTLANITKLEYFLDTDPGFGSGVDVPVTAAPDISGVAVAVSLNSVAAGFHTLNLRSKDANGKWSLTSVRSFYYEPALAVAPNINKIEYFFDTDPGFGSATNVAVPTPAPDLANFSFAADASALANGSHRLFVRSHDANGQWSLLSNRSFVKKGCGSSTNLAAGLPAGNYNQSATYSGSAQDVFNGGYWNSNTYNGTIQVDLGGLQQLSEVRYTPAASPTTSATYVIQTSANLTTWTTVDTYNTTVTAGTSTEIVRSFNTPLTNVRGLRIQATTPSSWTTFTGAGAYFFNCAGPAITSFTPTGGAGGTSVAITGTDLTGATALTFNGVAATSFTVNSATSITAIAPAGGSTGQLCVTTPNGTACSGTSYTYPPTIATGTVSATAFCSSTLIQVPFTTNTTAYNSGNQFKFQLSDANGVFTAGSRLYGNLISQSASGGVLRDSIAFRTAAGSGYRVRVVASNPAITGTDNGTNLTVYPTPAATASANSPVAYNGTIQLVAQPTGQALYYWYFSNGGGLSYVGNGQTLNLSNAQPSQSGKYVVYISTANSCQDTASVQVTVQPNAVPVLAMSQFGYTGCAGATFNIGFSVTGNSFAASNTISAQLSDASGSFAGPTVIGSAAFTGQGSGAISSTIPTNTPTGSGYRIRLVGSNPVIVSTTDNGANLGITTQPTATASSNSPVTYNGTIQLTAATVAGASYQWYGPGFASSQQNPTIPNATPGNSGTYTLYVTVNGCQSPGAPISVTVSPSAQPILTMSQFGGSLCPGSFLNIGFSVTGNSFASGNVFTAQLSDATGSFATPTAIGSVSGTGSGTVAVTIPAMAFSGGRYRVRVVASSPATTGTDNGTDLTITNQSGVTASSNSPVAVGSTIRLTSTGVVFGTTTDWTGPNGFSSNQGSPTIPNANAANAGTYTLVVTQNGCSVTRTVQVTVGTAALVLATGTVSGSFCPGAAIAAPYSVTTGSVNGGNTFSVQLSNASGSFASPVVIGSLSSSAASGTISAQIPVNTPAGSGYRVRVVADSPAAVGADNGADLTVGALTFVWTGGVSTDWFNGANWSCGQVPTATSVVTIPGGVSFYPIITGTTAAALNLTVQTGATFTVNTTFSLYGNVTVLGTVTALSTSSWYFAGSGSQYLYGTSPLQVGTVYINSGVNFYQQGVLNVYASWYNYGGYVGGAGYNVYFNGAGGLQYIGGTAVTTFYNAYVNSGAVVNLGINTVFLNNFVVNGTFGAVNYGVVFGGTAGQTIGGTGTSTYYNVTINNTVGLTLVSNITVLGNWINNGLFSGGTYSVIFAGTVAQIIGGTQVTNFYNVNFQNPISVTLHQHIYVLGGFVNSGIFYGYQTVGGITTGYFVRFGGTTAQVITANATTYFYHFYADNAAGVSLSSNVYIAGNYYLYSGLFTPGNYTVYFNGTVPGYVQTVGGYTGLSFYGWNIGSAASVRLLQNVTLLGDFANAGTFYGYNLVSGIYTGYTFAFGGTVAQGLTGAGVYDFWHLTWNNLAGVTLNRNISLRGDWLHYGGFLANGYLVTFGGSALQFIGGTVATIFHHFTIATGATVRQDLGITLLGNWTNNGLFNPNGLLTYFNGTVLQTIAGTALTTFYDVTFNNAVNVSLGQNIDVTHNFSNSGGYCGCGFRTRFNGPAAQSITCTSGRTHFHDITFDNPTGVTLLDGIYVSGLWVNNGGYLANNQTVIFDGTVLQSIGGSVLTAFYNIGITNVVDVQLLRDISVGGFWNNTGIFHGNGFGTTFNGLALQTITTTGTLARSYFHHITGANLVGCVLGGDIYVAGNWLCNGPFNPATWTVYFNGTVAQTCGGAQQLRFFGLNCSNPAGVTYNGPVYLLGNFVNTGLVNCGTYGWYCTGPGPQTIGGISTTPTRFYDLFIQNATGVTATDNWFVTHVLTPTTGNLASNGHLTLVSNATGTAMVVNPVGGGVVTGVSTMERFITGLSGAPGYRHYSSPMKLSAGAISTTVQEFADDLPVFELNPAYNTVGNSATPFPTVFKYDETRLTASLPTFDQGWMVPTATEDLLPLRGYTAQTLPTTTVDISGELNTGSVSYSLGRGSLANSGWHLLGNPYPAPMDWDVVRATTGMLTGVADALYVFQPSGQYTGTYKAYVNGLGQNGGTKDLAAMQGFFVRATAPTAAVSLTNATRATSYLSPVFERQGTNGTGPVAASGPVRPVLRLEARNVASGNADETVIYFEAAAALGFSPQHDAYKMQLNGNGRPSLWSQAGTDGFAINGLPALATAPVIPLGVRVSVDGNHELALTGLTDVPAGTQVWLEDRVLNRRQNLAADSAYAFTMLATFNGPRFYLNFVAGAPLAVTTGQLAARTAIYPNPTTGQATLELAGLREQGTVVVEVVNVLGQTVRRLSARPRLGLLTQPLDLRELPTGVYSVRIHAQEGLVVKRLVKD